MNRILNTLFALLLLNIAVAQDKGKTVDRVVAVVGNQIVKESDIENAYTQNYQESGIPFSDSLRGVILDELLFRKLLIAQAKKDSLSVSESEINGELDRRMRYYIMQFGSQKKFEEFYGKTVDAFKFELHDEVEELLLAQKMQGTIVSGAAISPVEVKTYYNHNIDSMPFINSEVEVGQIVMKPTVNSELKEYAKAELEGIRQRVITGKMDFCAAAATYSKDPGSKFNCGQYDNVRRGTFVPEFDAVCFSLKEGEISDVFETEYGFHFVQLTSRKGEEVTIRHILYEIPIAPDDLKKAKVRLDSVMLKVRQDSLKFCEAAAKFSSDDDSKYACGLLINPLTGTTKIDVELLGQIDMNPEFPIMVNQMKPGAYSAAHQMVTKDGKAAYRVLWLKSRSEPHKANLKDDYQMIQDMALEEKQNKMVDAWVRKKLEVTYIKISDDYKHYQFRFPWLQYNQ
ncbi:MAG: peptidylprolyl isomerase [Bacteroidia bacterium]